MGLKTTYYLRTLGASQVEKSTVSTAEFGSTHMRNTFSEQAMGVLPEVREVAVEETAVTSTVYSFEDSSSEDESSAISEEDLRLARIMAGEEVGLCESCEG